jgi:cytochrome c-type biogenesis protein CcmF
MASFGQLMLCVAAVLSALGGAICLARGTERRFFAAGRNLLYAAATVSTAALLILVFLLVTHDYRVEYVRDYADRSMSLTYLFTAVWGGQAGSLALWAVLQTWFTAAAAAWLGRRDLAPAPIALGFLAALQVFWLLLVLFHCDPFEPLGTVASRGQGINPLLRNPYMAFHPPTLFIGFVGFSVPMAFALAALLDPRVDDSWLAGQRPWILFAWIFLTIGNALGMIWAYEELGWGGYWGWDPVENASLMPWLTSTALLHSAMAEQRRGVLRRWNILLILLTFELIIFGTFLTRSGVIASVHAFAGATVGPYLLSLIAVTGVLTIGLLFFRLVKLRPKRALRGAMSREALALVNNWVFLAAAGFIWIATMMPLLTEVFRGEKITLTPEFFNRWMIPIGMVLLGLLALCGIIAWRRLKSDELFGRIAPPVLIGSAIGCLTVLLLGVRTDQGLLMGLAPAISAGLLGVVGTAILMEIRRIILSRSEQPTRRLGRRLGAQLVHLSVLMMFVGFTGSAFTEETAGSLAPGEHLSVSGYRVSLIGLRGDNDVERQAVFADLDVRGPDGTLGVMSPAKFIYHTHPNQPTSEVVISSNLVRDVFLILGETDPANGRAVIRAVINPLVTWIWLGGILLVLGTLVALIKLEAITTLLALDDQTRARLVRPVAAVGLTILVAVLAGLVRNLAVALVAVGAVLVAGTIYFLGTAALRLARPGGQR